MKLEFLAALVVLGFSTSAIGQNVRISWVGQSCFIVQSDGGPVVVTDPPAASVGYTIPGISADAVTVTHNHADHNNTAGVKGNVQIVDGRTVNARTQITAANLPFVLIPGFHDGQARRQVRGDHGGIESANSGFSRPATRHRLGGARENSA
jgi:hypothetical protein